MPRPFMDNSRKAGVCRRPAKDPEQSDYPQRDPDPKPVSSEWLEHIKEVYPNRRHQAYFLPPLYFKKFPHVVQDFHGQRICRLGSSPAPQVSSPTKDCQKASQKSGEGGDTTEPLASRLYVEASYIKTVQESDLQEQDAQQWVLHHLEVLAETTKDVMMVISRLSFMNYLANTPEGPPAKRFSIPDLQQGDFDLLIIHRSFGIFVAEMKSLKKHPNVNDKEFRSNILGRINDAIVQLNKAEQALKEFTKDLDSIKITKLLLLPNVSNGQLKDALVQDGTTKALRQCLRSSACTSHCLTSDLLSAPNPDWTVDDSKMEVLITWWKELTAIHCDAMTEATYDSLLCRFCGPATSVTIPSVTAPYRVIKTLGECVAETGLQFSLLALFPQQIETLLCEDPALFLTGPPGTGKTIVLALKAQQWLAQGRTVHLVSTQARGRAVHILLEKQILTSRQKRLAASTNVDPSMMNPEQPKVKRHSYCFELHEEDVERAVKDLAALADVSTGVASQGGRGSGAEAEKELYVIADEIGKKYRDRFAKFCTDLKEKVPNLHIWVACWRSHGAPSFFKEMPLNTMLRCPPMVHKEVKKSEMLGIDSAKYSQEEAHAPTRGPRVRKQIHRGMPKHDEGEARDCRMCGLEIAEFLTSLGIVKSDGDGGRMIQGVVSRPTSSSARPSSGSSRTGGFSGDSRCEFRDVLIIYYNPDDDMYDATKDQLTMAPSQPGFVRGLQDAGVPFRVLRRHDPDDVYADVALAKSDVVTVSHCENVSGLERRVVIGVQDEIGDSDRFFSMSRCTSQLVWVSNHAGSSDCLSRLSDTYS